ncbi:hypothetical protein C8J56DRAFT_909935 [Mycena floridula]|nr:hypothetical protein C8J56DRAFT_909935 [Mycena floridula]
MVKLFQVSALLLALLSFTAAVPIVKPDSRPSRPLYRRDADDVLLAERAENNELVARGGGPAAIVQGAISLFSGLFHKKHHNPSS